MLSVNAGHSRIIDSDFGFATLLSRERVRVRASLIPNQATLLSFNSVFGWHNRLDMGAEGSE